MTSYDLATLPSLAFAVSVNGLRTECRRRAHLALYLGDPARTSCNFQIKDTSEVQPELSVCVEVSCRRSAVSAVIRRRSCAISPMQVAGTWNSSASLLTVRPGGFIRSSRRTSPGCTGGINPSDVLIFVFSSR